jgi:pimeloyl-[acyl-carrier protein] synthase
MLVSGFETTANLIANGVQALLTHTEQLAMLRTHPELIQTAVDELLRYGGPGIINARLAKTDVRIADVDIRQGDTIVLDLDAANQDPAQFEHAGELDLTRQPNPHVQFGHGWVTASARHSPGWKGRSRSVRSSAGSPT